MKGWAKGKFQLVCRRWGIEDRQKKKKTPLRIYFERVSERWGPILLLDPWGGEHPATGSEGRETSKIIIKGINRRPVFPTRHNATSQSSAEVSGVGMGIWDGYGACSMRAKCNPICLKKDKLSSLYALLYPTPSSKPESL